MRCETKGGGRGWTGRSKGIMVIYFSQLIEAKFNCLGIGGEVCGYNHQYRREVGSTLKSKMEVLKCVTVLVLEGRSVQIIIK